MEVEAEEVGEDDTAARRFADRRRQYSTTDSSRSRVRSDNTQRSARKSVTTRNTVYQTSTLLRRRANHRHATAAVRSVEKRLKGLAVCMLAGVFPEGGHGTAVAGMKRGQGGMPD